MNCYTDICDPHTWLKPSQIAERQTAFNDPAIVFLSTSAWNALIKAHKSIALIVDPVALSFALFFNDKLYTGETARKSDLQKHKGTGHYW
ncbi:MAG: hypothetical protein ACLTXT_02495 [Ruminococcus callidus]